MGNVTPCGFPAFKHPKYDARPQQGPRITTVEANYLALTTTAVYQAVVNSAGITRSSPVRDNSEPRRHATEQIDQKKSCLQDQGSQRQDADV